jgi:hypothetical protein
MVRRPLVATALLRVGSSAAARGRTALFGPEALMKLGLRPCLGTRHRAGSVRLEGAALRPGLEMLRLRPVEALLLRLRPLEALLLRLRPLEALLLRLRPVETLLLRLRPVEALLPRPLLTRLAVLDIALHRPRAVILTIGP